MVTMRLYESVISSSDHTMPPLVPSVIILNTQSIVIANDSDRLTCRRSRYGIIACNSPHLTYSMRPKMY